MRAGNVHRRLLAVLAVMALGCVAMSARLVQVQQLDSARYIAYGEQQREGTRDLPAPRGSIRDRHGKELAVSADRPTIWLDPLFTDRDRAVAELPALLGIDQEAFARRLDDAIADEGRFIYASRQVEPAVSEAVLGREIEGVHALDEPARIRPNGDNVAPGILGAVDPDHLGISGLEKMYDEVLRGEPGQMLFERDSSGVIIPTGRVLVDEAEPGDDIVLTLDRGLQWLTEETLLETLQEFSAAWAAAVVLRTDTAEILAMASVETDDSGQPRVSTSNRAVTDAFEPGSVTKVVPVAAALDRGLVTPGTYFHVTPRLTLYEDVELGDEHAFEARDLTVTEIVQKSSNVGTIKIAQLLERQGLYDSLVEFGFGRPTGVGGSGQFPGESAGILADVEDWNGASLPTISYGQGVAVTALQLAAAYNVIGNDGLYRTPTMVREAVSPDGTVTSMAEIEQRQVISAATAAQMRQILEGVVHGDGTGRLAAIPGYRAAGKTGTARKPSAGGYLDDSWISTFAGFAPADDPAITVVVLVDDPKPDYYGGLVAAPVFREVAEFALGLLNVEPTEVTPARDQADA